MAARIQPYVAAPPPPPPVHVRRYDVDGKLSAVDDTGDTDKVVTWIAHLAEGVPRGTAHRVLIVHPTATLRIALESLELSFPKGGEVLLFVLDAGGQLWHSHEAELGPEIGRVPKGSAHPRVPDEAFTASTQAATLRGNFVERVLHEAVHDRHGFLGDGDLRVHLLEYARDVGLEVVGVGFLPARAGGGFLRGSALDLACRLRHDADNASYEMPLSCCA